MREDEFEASPLMTAWASWVDYMRRVVQLNKTMPDSIGLVVQLATMLKGSPPPLGQITNATQRAQDAALQKSIDDAQHEIDKDFETVHAMTLMAAWGAFEAYVEDVCRATLALEPALLRTDAFKKVTLKAETLLLTDPLKQMEVVFGEAIAKVGTDLKVGIGKFETQLNLVGLGSDGDLTDDLRKTIEFGGQLRNIWAHKAGRADAQFIENTGNHFDVPEGETVSISTPVMHEMLGAIRAYGWLIINRFRLRRGLPYLSLPFEAADSHFALAYIARWQAILDQTGKLTNTSL